MKNSMFTHNLLRNRTAQLTDAERLTIENAISHTRTFEAGTVIVRPGLSIQTSTLLIDGLMTRGIDAQDGRRHLVGIHVPGDFVDLHAYALKKIDHEITALTEVTCAIFSHVELHRIQENDSDLTRQLWFSTLLDAAMHRQWIYRLASLNAIQRVGHFFCETNARLLAIGASDGATFSLPMTQAVIGEVCGLTNVHVNRVLREMREKGLCDVRSSKVQVGDLRGLAAISSFDPDYLYLNDRINSQVRGASV